MYSKAARFFPNFLFISGRLCSIFSKESVLNTMIFLTSSIFQQWMLSLVMMPMVPSPPMKRCFRSQPVLSLWIQERRSRISPLGRTASRPKMCERKEPYLMTYFPPALVEAFPPIWQDPFAPKSSGVSKPQGSMYSFNFSRMTPASHPTIELTSLKPSILFMFFRLTMIQSKTGTLPPTSPVFPPCGTTASLRWLQCASILDTCSVLQGHRRSLEWPLSSFRKQMLWGSITLGSSEIAWDGRNDWKYAMSCSLRVAKPLRLKLCCQYLKPIALCSIFMQYQYPKTKSCAKLLI